MQTFGNLTVRSQNEQRAQEAAAGIEPRTCMKCSWQCHPAEQWCPRCGVVFAKARAEPVPTFSAPAPREFEPLAPEAPDDAPYYFGELRVLSMVASIAALALVASKATEPLDVVFVLHFVALLTWVGARAFDWGVKHGFIGFVVIFFVTGWIWPLMGKPTAWVARVVSSALPRATSWMPAAVLLVLACAVAVART